MIRTILAAFLLAACAASAASAAPSIAVTSAWARATPPGAPTGAAYLTMTNQGAPDRLLGASTPVAGMAQLHTTINDNGVLKMRPLETLDLKSGAAVTLKPGGMHIMLMNLHQPLKEGETFPLALTFAKAGRIETMVKVEKIGAMSGMDMQGMDMK